MRKKQYDLGIADLTTVIELDPNNVWHYQRRALAYIVSGKAVYGLSDIDRAIAAKPNEARFHNTRGLLLEDIGRRPEAIESYRASLALDPNVQDSRDALKRLRAHASSRAEWEESLAAWRDAVVSWVQTQWDSPNKFRWVLPLAVLLMAFFGGNTSSLGGTSATHEGGGEGNRNKRSVPPGGAAD